MGEGERLGGDRRTCEYGDIVVHLDTATEDEIQSATEVKTELFRDD
jgi:hypothetical protein